MKSFCCFLCGDVFHKLPEFQEHCDIHQDVVPPYECPLCGKSYADRKTYFNHSVKHSTESNFKSRIKEPCKLEPTEKVQDAVIVTYICDRCGLTFENESIFANHQKKYFTKTLACKICGREYKHEKNLIRHLQKHESKDTETNISEILKKSHSEATNEDDHKRFSCAICRKRFSHRTSLLNHKVVHSGKKCYQCTYCGQSFGYLANLTVHIRTHTGERPYQCEFCKKTFVRIANLSEHTKIHTGEKPVSCEYCGKGFVSTSGYVKHRKIHTGERPHKCRICDKSFVQLVHLKKHILTHTGERPHRCDVCKKFYRRKDTLRKHLLLHERGFSVAQEKCEVSLEIR